MPREDSTFHNLKKAYEIPVHDGPLALSASSAIKTKNKVLLYRVTIKISLLSNVLKVRYKKPKPFSRIGSRVFRLLANAKLNFTHDMKSVMYLQWTNGRL